MMTSAIMRVYLCALVLLQALQTLCMVRSGNLMNRLVKVNHVHHQNKLKYAGPKPVWHHVDMNWIDEYCKEHPTTLEPPPTMPEHIDEKQFEVTSPIPYVTLGPIPGIDHHPPLLNISSCERIYIDHFEQSESTYDYTDESLEMIQVPYEQLFNHTHDDSQGRNDMDYAAIPMPMYPMYQGY